MSLIEVLCATLILVVCCLVIIGLLPAALKTQQMTRYRIYAAAATTTMSENVANMPTDFQDIVGRYGYNDYYAKLTNAGTAQPPTPGWATRIRHAAVLGSAFAPDFEQIVATVNNAAIPVPLEIANRLDSDGGEIAAHLRAGGALYYLPLFRDEWVGCGQAQSGDRMRRSSLPAMR
jgi:Tfp pilus assembly protein PilV